MFRTLIPVFLLLIFLTSCEVSSFTSSFFDTPSGAVLFQDDFTDSSSGWENLTHEQYGTLDYFDGYYRMQVIGEQQMVLASPGFSFSDVHLETDTFKVIGSSDDIFGLVCRVIDQDNYYFFVISSDGYYGIGKVIDDIQSMSNASGMLPSEVINQGKSGNHLRADCVGDRLELRVNGQLLARVNEIELVEGEVGLLVGNFNSVENVVLFDNFSVINP
jgi:hypothetical protein